MSGFAIKHPFFILMLCMIVVVVGVTTVSRMPVDLFPQIRIPVVIVATFYCGMPPQQIEGDITDPTAIVFFPVVFLSGVSKYLFTALALGVVLALAGSYLVAMSVVPLFCSRFIKSAQGDQAHGEREGGWLERLLAPFNRRYDYVLTKYDESLQKALDHPKLTVSMVMGAFVLSLALSPFLGIAFFPRTDPGQFVINVKAPSGTRIEPTNAYVARVEEDIRQVVNKEDLGMIVSHIGVNADLSAIYTTNSAVHTAFVQVQLKEDHKGSTFSYINRVRQRLSSDLPELSTFIQTGGLVDSIVNQGMPAPLDIQVTGNDQHVAYEIAGQMAQHLRRLSDVRDVLIPHDLDYPGIQLNVNREMAARLGLTASSVVENVITALASNGMIAPSYWIDPRGVTTTSLPCSTRRSKLPK